jgi:hypothetical protein
MEGWINFWALVVAQLVLLVLAEFRLRRAEQKSDSAKKAALEGKHASESNAATMKTLPPIIAETVKAAVLEVNQSIAANGQKPNGIATDQPP